MRKREKFITTHKEVANDFICVQLIRILPTALSSLISIQDQIDDIAKRISKLPRPTHPNQL